MKAIYVVIAVLTLLIAGACAPAAPPKPGVTPPKPEIIHLKLGSAPTASGVYVGCAGQVKTWNKNVPGVSVTAVEVGGPTHNIDAVEKGYVEIGVGSTAQTFYKYYGLDIFAGKPWTELRLLYNWGPMFVHYMVRADSGITKLSELSGKKFHPAIKGSTADLMTRKMFDALGIKPDYYIAGFADANAAMRDGRIVGVAKASQVAVLDSMLLEIKTAIPVRFLSFTKEEMEIARKVAPDVSWREIKRGDIKNALDAGPVFSWEDHFNTFTTTKLSADLVYKLVKGITENWKTDFAVIYAEAEWYDPIAQVLRDADVFERVVPLHAGAVKYFTEKGYKVPAKYIPPEYK